MCTQAQCFQLNLSHTTLRPPTLPLIFSLPRICMQGQKVAGGAASAATLTLGIVVGSIAGPIGFLVKRGRTKKAVAGIAEMLQAYREVQARLYALLTAAPVAPAPPVMGIPVPNYYKH